MKSAVVVFPGLNRDRDMIAALTAIGGEPPVTVWHKDTDIPDVDLTTELITHRFTPASKDVLLSWYPRTKLEMDEDSRTRKRSKFGGIKYVYPRETMVQMRSWFSGALADKLPQSRQLYWT